MPSHEKEIFENVAAARAGLMNATGAQQAAQADNVLTQALGRLFAVAEAYPDLKANQNFLELQRELTDTEDKIAYSRQFYNTNVSSYNQKIQVFPNVLIAGMFHFNHPNSSKPKRPRARTSTSASAPPSECTLRN